VSAWARGQTGGAPPRSFMPQQDITRTKRQVFLEADSDSRLDTREIMHCLGHYEADPSLSVNLLLTGTTCSERLCWKEGVLPSHAVVLQVAHRGVLAGPHQGGSRRVSSHRRCGVEQFGAAPSNSVGDCAPTRLEETSSKHRSGGSCRVFETTHGPHSRGRQRNEFAAQAEPAAQLGLCLSLDTWPPRLRDIARPVRSVGLQR
jgi:hypothetical protein